MPNNSRRGWQTSPPPYGQPMGQMGAHPAAWPQQPVPYPVPHDLGMMLGRIFERTETTADQVSEMRADISEMKQRLIRGDARFEHIEQEMQELGEAAKHPPAVPAAPPAPPSTPPSSFWALMGPAILKSLLGLVLLASASAGVLPWDVVKDLVARLPGK